MLRLVPVPDAPEPATDAELIGRARRGDEAAFEELYGRCLPPVRRFLRDLLRDEPAAEEAAQETFARAFVRIRGLRDQERALPWLLGIARNVSLEARRDQGRPVRAVGLDVALALLEAGDPEPGDGGAASPERALLGREAHRELGELLARLSEDRRAVLLLRVDHDLGCAEIAQLMGWSIAKVKVEVHRARLELRALLAAKADKEGAR